VKGNPQSTRLWFPGPRGLRQESAAGIWFYCRWLTFFCWGSTRAATSSNFQPYDLYLKIVCRADLALQSLEGGTNELLNFPAIKARKMEMIFLCLDLVVVLFTVEVHQVQFIDHPEALQQLDGSIHRSSIDIRISIARQLQQALRVQMSRRLLNGLNQRAALRG
jgi:hypothetical protein